MADPRITLRPTIGQLLDLPERVNPSDYVLKLSEAVSDPEATLRKYVVTPDLMKSFTKAMAIVKDAVEHKESRATYLHGSFGAGKSHFMAVLYLLLSGNTQARSVPGLAPVVSAAGWTSGRKFLLVPYHMIGAESVEERVLGGYVDHLAAIAPGKAPAPVYRSDSLIENARVLRHTMGDVVFLDALNKNKSGGGWGKLDEKWDVARFERACAEGPHGEERLLLVSDLVSTLLPSARQKAEFVSFDAGLSIISRHAESLGYAGLILFLDELILWLASRAGSVEFVTNEASKLVKLVEAGEGKRPVPIISFVARQRDLRTVLGQHAMGSEVKNFEDALNYFEARFDLIELKDRDLPVIAEKRVLVPKNAAARELMDQEFEKVKAFPDPIKDVLLTQDGDLAQFRQVYPFSVALMKTLIGVSSALQRERTALKIMVQLLVDQRDTLRLGEIVPVGDLFAIMLKGQDAFSKEMQQTFANARRLWEQKLRPLVEETCGIRYDELDTVPAGDPRSRRLKENERIIGTLVLGALTPEVETLKALTPRKLAALNHGSIQVAIPGTESNSIWTRIQDWAARVGEIKVNGSGADAVITLQLSGVDTAAILANAAHEDNHGNRLQVLRSLLLQDLGLRAENAIYYEYDFKWKATDRTAELRFANVWETDDNTLRPSGDLWQVIIDYPFDRENHRPADDMERLHRFRSAGGSARTLVWMPSFFSQETRTELGRLVILDFLLANDQRLKDYSQHLSSVERNEARALLANQQEQLREKVRRAIRQAYGITTADPRVLDPGNEMEQEDKFQSLEPSLNLRPPVGSNLGEALNGLLSQALNHEFPAHPDFRSDEVKITDGALKRAFERIQEAIAEGGRVLVEREFRKQLRPLLEGLQLAAVGEQWLVMQRFWMDHFDRYEAQNRGPVTVRNLREWMDKPDKRGLPVSLQNLIMQTYVLQANRLLLLQGVVIEPGSTAPRDEMVVEKQELPSEQTWAMVVARAGMTFGVTGSPLLNAQNMASLATQVQKIAKEYAQPVADYLAKLRTVLTKTGLAEPKPARLQTAEAVEKTISGLGRTTRHIEIIRKIERMTIATSEDAMSRSLKQASSMRDALEGVNLRLFEGLGQITDEPRATAAKGLIERLHEALSNDEYVVQPGLAVLIPSLEERATELLVPAAQPPAPPIPTSTPPAPPVVVDGTPEPGPTPHPPAPAPPAPGHRPRQIVAQGSKTARGVSGWKQVAREIEQALDEGTEIAVTWEITKEQEE